MLPNASNLKINSSKGPNPRLRLFGMPALSAFKKSICGEPPSPKIPSNGGWPPLDFDADRTPVAGADRRPRGCPAKRPQRVWVGGGGIKGPGQSARTPTPVRSRPERRLAQTDRVPRSLMGRRGCLATAPFDQVLGSPPRTAQPSGVEYSRTQNSDGRLSDTSCEAEARAARCTRFRLAARETPRTIRAAAAVVRAVWTAPSNPSCPRSHRARPRPVWSSRAALGRSGKRLGTPAVGRLQEKLEFLLLTYPEATIFIVD